ncbi:MAG: hypothetical protein U1F67_16925 [Rubrivivax sp.]
MRRIAVFRALMLGDMLCALPALRALKAGFPGAQVALIGLPWAAEWAARLAEVDDFIAFPGYPAFAETPTADVGALPFFLATVQARRFDLAVRCTAAARAEQSAGGDVRRPPQRGIFAPRCLRARRRCGAAVPALA